MTKEEARLTLQDNFGYLSQEHPRILEALRVALDVLFQPSLPPNIDEAAAKYADINSQRWFEDGDIYYDHSKIMDAFKAGAELMAAQGETIGTFIERITNDEEEFLGILVAADTFKEGDKVIVQIRKKQ